MVENSIYKDKKGWIRIVEAFVAILLITGVVLIVLDKEYIRKDTSKEIYDVENAILKEIQLDDSLRQDILASIGEIYSDEAIFPLSIINSVEVQKPSYLDCKEKICDINSLCLIPIQENKNVYAQSVIITATNTQYNPKQLKLFCFYV